MLLERMADSFRYFKLGDCARMWGLGKRRLLCCGNKVFFPRDGLDIDGMQHKRNRIRQVHPHERLPPSLFPFPSSVDSLRDTSANRLFALLRQRVGTAHGHYRLECGFTVRNER